MTFSREDNNTLEEIASRLLECDNLVICGHVSPDGDCLGSELALYAALVALGKQVCCINASDEPIPYSLGFLPGAESIKYAPYEDLSCDAFVAVDVSTLSRFGNGTALFVEAGTTFIFDHHACEERIADYSYIDPDSPSASMIIWKLIQILCQEPPKASAVCAFTGLMTDTGGFRFQNTSADAFEVAADLVAHGAKPAVIATHVFQNQSYASLLLEKIALDHMQVFSNDEGVLSFITRADLESCKAMKSDTEHLIDVIRSLRGIRVACILREQEGSIKGSLRAKDETDVASLASTLNGGGHKAAAGFTLYMSMSEAIPFMRQKISEILSE